MPNTFMGGHAEYLIVTEVTPMGIVPDTMNFTDAAALPFGGTTALHFLSGLDLAGKTVFINGASGAVGVCFVQLAKARGAMVTAVTSAANEAVLKSLGATTVIDYVTTDILSICEEYDVVIDCVNKIPLRKIEQLVKPGGTIILLAGLIKEMWQSRKLKKGTVRIGSAKVTDTHFIQLSDLYTRGALRPVIESVFPLNEIQAAYTRVDSNRKVGSVVLDISASTPS
jgi:NADPH:quinone reductase-like Zn-dependent oxidoreductase